MKIQGIYAITHAASGRAYVGSAVNVVKRWWMHRSELTRGKHHAKRLQAAWNKYGATAFSFEVLEHVADLNNLIAREQAWIDAKSASNRINGFNTLPAAGSPLGTKRSDETRAKLRRAWEGRSKETVIAMGLRSRGRVLSPEHVGKMREAALKMSPETKARITAAMLGRIVSEETRQKLSIANKGQIVSEAQRQAVSKAHKGKVMSAASRAQMSASRMGHAVSDETRKKLSAASTAHAKRSRLLKPDRLA